MSRMESTANAPIDLPLRYTLGGGRFGVTSLVLYLRTVIEAAFWLGAAPYPSRLLGRVGARRWSAISLGWWARGLGWAMGLRIDCSGLERIDPNERYVVVPLHEGVADILALQRLPLQMRFVVRDELLHWPLLGPALRDTSQIVIRPEQGLPAYRQLRRSAQEVFAAGESLVVFPQGSILGIETAFQRGAFALAREVERPILPVALTGGHRVWEYPYGPRLRRHQRMSLRVLSPVPVSELRERGSDAVLRDLQQRLKSAALEDGMVPPRRFVPSRDGYWDDYAYEIDPAFPDLATEVAQHRAHQTLGD